MSGFAGFHGGVRPSSELVPTLASASAGSLVVGGARQLAMNDKGEDVAATLLTHGRSFNAKTFAFQHHRHAGAPADVAPTLTSHHNEQPGIMGFSRHSTLDAEHETSPTNTAGTGAPMVDDGDLRKMTPVECERLQGFPDGWTAVPTGRRNKAMEDPEYRAYQTRALAHLGYTEDQLATVMPDGPRYKMIGNSWAVPCARWVGERIAAVEEVLLMRDLGVLP